MMQERLHVASEEFTTGWLRDCFWNIVDTVDEDLRLDGTRRVMPGHPSLRPHFVYVLKLQRDDAYYVGLTANLEHRLAQHINGIGAAITSRLKVDYDLGAVQVGSERQASRVERRLYQVIKATGRKASIGRPASACTAW